MTDTRAPQPDPVPASSREAADPKPNDIRERCLLLQGRIWQIDAELEGGAPTREELKDELTRLSALAAPPEPREAAEGPQPHCHQCSGCGVKWRCEGYCHDVTTIACANCRNARFDVFPYPKTAPAERGEARPPTDWSAICQRILRGGATVEDAYAFIEAELLEADSCLEPSAPKNGRVIDGWHASACVIRALSVLGRMKRGEFAALAAPAAQLETKTPTDAEIEAARDWPLPTYHGETLDVLLERWANTLHGDTTEAERSAIANVMDDLAGGLWLWDQLAKNVTPERLVAPAAEEVRPPDYVAVLHEAQALVRASVLWKRFIDGTPLENDIAVWMTDFALDVLKRHNAEVASPGRRAPAQEPEK